MTTFEFLRREPEIRDFKKGQTIFKQGDPGSDCMFGVVEGAIDIQIGAETVERVHPTHIFGEMALIDQRPRSATAIAAVDSRIGGDQQEAFPPPRRSYSELCAQYDAGDYRAPAPRQRTLAPKLAARRGLPREVHMVDLECAVVHAANFSLGLSLAYLHFRERGQ